MGTETEAYLCIFRCIECLEANYVLAWLELTVAMTLDAQKLKTNHGQVVMFVVLTRVNFSFDVLKKLWTGHCYTNSTENIA
jgi:hypothetical protein